MHVKKKVTFLSCLQTFFIFGIKNAFLTFFLYFSPKFITSMRLKWTGVSTQLTGGHLAGHCHAFYSRVESAFCDSFSLCSTSSRPIAIIYEIGLQFYKLRYFFYSSLIDCVILCST